MHRIFMPFDHSTWNFLILPIISPAWMLPGPTTPQESFSGFRKFSPAARSPWGRIPLALHHLDFLQQLFASRISCLLPSSPVFQTSIWCLELPTSAPPHDLKLAIGIWSQRPRPLLRIRILSCSCRDLPETCPNLASAAHRIDASQHQLVRTKDQQISSKWWGTKKKQRFS